MPLIASHDPHDQEPFAQTQKIPEIVVLEVSHENSPVKRGQKDRWLSQKLEESN